MTDFLSFPFTNDPQPISEEHKRLKSLHAELLEERYQQAKALKASKRLVTALAVFLAFQSFFLVLGAVVAILR